MSVELRCPTLKELEDRNYATWILPQYAGRIEHAIRRDRIVYFLLQMREFWHVTPWDLPPWHEGRQYSVFMLGQIDMRTDDLHALHELLTSLEADVVLAAQERGFRLKRRPCDGGVGGRRGQGEARYHGGSGFERGG